MNYYEKLGEVRVSSEKRKHYFVVKTTNDGDFCLYAEKQMVNESGAIIFLNSTPNGEKMYPVYVFGPREYVAAWLADPKDNRPIAEA